MAEDHAVACGMCGTVVQGQPPLTWSTQSGPRGVTQVCQQCTRDNLRSIEAKLEQEWW